MYDKLKSVYVDERKFMTVKDLVKYIIQLCICLLAIGVGLIMWESVIFAGFVRHLLMFLTVVGGLYMGHEILWGFRDDRTAVLTSKKFFNKFWWLGFVFIGVSIVIMRLTLIIL